MAMRLWHQSFTVLEDVPMYVARMQEHARRVVRPDTVVDLHGMMPGTFPANYPGDDMAFSPLFALHGAQWMLNARTAAAQGYDGIAMCTLVDPLLHEIKSLAGIPVVGAGEASFHTARLVGRRFGLAELDRARLGCRQRQRHDRVARIGRNVERRRRRQLVRNGEWSAVRKDSGRAENAELAKAREILVDGDRREAPGIRLDTVDAGPDVRVEIAFLGLKVLRPEEHAFAPGYAVLTGHAQAPVGRLIKHSFTSS